jgi:hypothetical protein
MEPLMDAAWERAVTSGTSRPCESYFDRARTSMRGIGTDRPPLMLTAHPGHGAGEETSFVSAPRRLHAALPGSRYVSYLMPAISLSSPIRRC